MKFVSWNVNGLRAIVSKNFTEVFTAFDADFFCLQETKVQAGQIELDFDGYESYWNYADKKGYSGTAIFTRHTPLSVSYGLGIAAHDREGRLITLEYADFYLVNCYTPNSQPKLQRLAYRLEWEDDIIAYLSTLSAAKPVIYCGDFNVAHQDIDLKNDKTNHNTAGFTDDERAKLSALLSRGFTDTFRYFYPDTEHVYTWWNYRFNARRNNAGWRIDYFIVSDALRDRLIDAGIHMDIEGSDHCPISLETQALTLN